MTLFVQTSVTLKRDRAWRMNIGPRAVSSALRAYDEDQLVHTDRSQRMGELGKRPPIPTTPKASRNDR